ncbi:MAG: aminopeptidase P family protein [Nitrososphaerota archaeon]|nr:aminopeptidase P family protein [Nitrososphaerota archaeon]MDG6922116.1 aminopeptidase P family protein [Nitrososphaerota archaeon]
MTIINNIIEISRGGNKISFDRRNYSYPTFSDKEYQRRYDAVYKMMDQKELDCLLVNGGNHSWERGWTNINWLTNFKGDLELSMYFVLPREGESTLTTRTLAPHRVACAIVRDVRFGDMIGIAIQRIKEIKPKRGKRKIGIVESGHPIYRTEMDMIRMELSDSELEFVTDDFMQLRWEKSDEELAWLQKSAEMGDAVMEAWKTQMRPGMTEGDLFGIAHHIVYSKGGEPKFMNISSGAMTNSTTEGSRPQPMARTISNGDIIHSEIGPRYWGYETQIGRNMAFGQPTDEVKQMFEVAREAYKRVTDQFRIGKGYDDVWKAGQVIKESGYKSAIPPFMHGVVGSNFRDGPVVPGVGMEGLNDHFTKGNPFNKMSFRKNIATVCEISVCRKDELFGVQLTNTLVVTDGAPRCLHKFPVDLTVI